MLFSRARREAHAYNTKQSTPQISVRAGLQVHKTMSIPDFLAATADLVEPVDAYFDKVFVMTDNEQVKRNRLALLRQIASLSEGILDFSQLPGF
jgi:glycyl-tRNA synthetase